MKKKVIVFIWVAVISLILPFAIARLGGVPFGHHIKFGMNLFYGFAIVLFSRRFRDKKTYFAITLLPSIIISFIILNYITHWKFYTLATPSTYSFFLGVLIGITALLIKNRVGYYFMFLLSAGIALYTYLGGYDLWLHKLNYGTFSGKQNISIADISLGREDSSIQNLDNPDTYYLLDFWTTTCVICIEQFPEVQTLFNKYSGEKNKLKIYLVNVPYDSQDVRLAEDILKKRNIHIPLLYFKGSNDERRNKYHVFAYPTTLIIKGNRIIHLGNLSSAMKRLKELSL